MQTSLIQNAHGDLVTDTAYDFYGVRLATCSLDHRIKIWQLDESDGTWTAVAEWKVRVVSPFASPRGRFSICDNSSCGLGPRCGCDETLMGTSRIRFRPREFLL